MLKIPMTKADIAITVDCEKGTISLHHISDIIL